jgi:hypothetical protein
MKKIIFTDQAKIISGASTGQRLGAFLPLSIALPRKAMAM